MIASAERGGHDKWLTSDQHQRAQSPQKSLVLASDLVEQVRTAFNRSDI
jgi:hypothetical protein